MCMYTQMCIHTHEYVSMHTQICTHTHACVCGYTQICIHTHVCVCTYAQIHIHMHTYACMCYMSVYTHAHICVYVCNCNPYTRSQKLMPTNKRAIKNMNIQTATRIHAHIHATQHTNIHHLFSAFRSGGCKTSASRSYKCPYRSYPPYHGYYTPRYNRKQHYNSNRYMSNACHMCCEYTPPTPSTPIKPHLLTTVVTPNTDAMEVDAGNWLSSWMTLLKEEGDDNLSVYIHQEPTYTQDNFTSFYLMCTDPNPNRAAISVYLRQNNIPVDAITHITSVSSLLVHLEVDGSSHNFYAQLQDLSLGLSKFGCSFRLMQSVSNTHST